MTLRLRLSLVALALIPLAIYLYNPNQLLLEHHAYRQTQTALTTYWIIHSGFSLDYLTPVLGFPWSVPLEFPFYQIVVAFLVEATGWSLDITGRTVSLFFYYLTFIPMFYILRPYGVVAIAIGFALVLTSPIEIFFARSFSIETLGTLLSLSALACYFNYMRSNRISSIIFFVVLGSLAALQKVTTFAPVILLCTLDVLFTIAWKKRPFIGVNKGRLLLLVFICSSMIAPMIWTELSDNIKQAGFLSSYITSTAMHDWVFGTVSTRLDILYWLKVFGYRLVLLGGFVVALSWLMINVYKGTVKIGRESWMLIGIGLSAPLIFAKLFYVHDYYMMPSIVFFACGIAITIASSLGKPQSVLNNKIGLILTIMVVSNLCIFAGKYAEKIKRVPDIDTTSYDIARYLNSNVSPNDVVVIVGLDWNSTVPYYSERYALMVPTWVPEYKLVISKPSDYIGQRKIGAIVMCSTYESNLTSTESRDLFNNVDGDTKIYGPCSVKVASNSVRS